MGCCNSTAEKRDHGKQGSSSTAARKNNSRSQRTSESHVNPAVKDTNDDGLCNECRERSSEQPSLPRLSSAQEKNPGNWQPFRDPHVMMTEALRQLSVDDWERERDALNAVRRLAIHHDDVLCPELHTVTLAAVAEVRNLRSQVSRLAMVCLGDMYTHLKTNMDTDLELTVGVLLGKMGESNKFIREDADKALEVMVNSVSPAGALAALIACGVSHRNAMVRNAAARHLSAVVELIGPNRVLREFPDKVLPVAARFLLDGSPDARYSGSCVLYSLMSSNPDEFDSAVARHVPPKDQRNTEDKICQLKQKGLGPPPASMNKNYVSRATPNAR